VTASIIIDKDCDEIQAAMAVALLQLKNANGLTYEKIGKVIEREKQSVAQYICGTTEMPATCWVKAVAKWPELADRLEHNLDDAEKAFRAKQRTLNLQAPPPEEIAA
jgi:cyanate lyase